MVTLREWMHRLFGTLQPSSRDRDMEEELRLHMDLAGQEIRRRGASASEAERLARLKAGGVAQAMEELRDQRRALGSTILHATCATHCTCSGAVPPSRSSPC